VAAASPAILVVFPWCLDRTGHGNVQRVLSMARYVSARGVAVDLVYQGNPRVPSREHELIGFRRVLRVDGWHSSDDARLYAEWERFYEGHEQPSWNLSPGSALTAVVRSLLDAVPYTAVISSYAWTAPIFTTAPDDVLRIVDLHDVLSHHASRCLETTGRQAPFTLPFDTERMLWRHWDVLLAITRDEAALIEPTLRPDQRLLTVPHAVTSSEAVPPRPAPGTVVYTGSDNHSNQAAMAWLLTEVWPKVLAARPDATLRVVGLICGPLQQTPLGSTPGVDWRGLVDDPSVELASAAVCVAPYLYGSGLKIKVIEAAGAGCAVVTTSAGAEGSGLVHDTHALIEDDPSAFASAIVRLLDDKEARARLGSAALAHARRAFSDDACYGPLVDLIRAHATSARQAPALIPSAVVARARTAWSALGRPDVVVWGNGSHTRALVPALHAFGAHVRCIVDGGADQRSESPEGIDVLPRRLYQARRFDLVVLSSQVYEPEMWRDLALERAAGAHVLGLYRRELMTPSIRQHLVAGALSVPPYRAPSSRVPSDAAAR
jgi:glycosyltransferase involved in cell wall biosynthesis